MGQLATEQPDAEPAGEQEYAAQGEDSQDDEATLEEELRAGMAEGRDEQARSA